MKPDHKTQRERDRQTDRDYTISLIHGLVDAWHLWGSWIWWINRVPLSTENFPSYLQNIFDSVNLMRWPEVSSVPVFVCLFMLLYLQSDWKISKFSFLSLKYNKKKKIYIYIYINFSFENLCVFGNKIISKYFVFLVLTYRF